MSLKVRERCITGGGEGHNLHPSVNHSFIIQLLKNPPKTQHMITWLKHNIHLHYTFIHTSSQNKPTFKNDLVNSSFKLFLFFVVSPSHFFVNSYQSIYVSIKAARQNDWAFIAVSCDVMWIQSSTVTDLTRRSPWTTGTESYSHSWSQSNVPFSLLMSDVCKQQKQRRSQCVRDIHLLQSSEPCSLKTTDPK